MSFCFEEPEAHLHPKMQVALADLVAACLNHDIFFQFTTHSDYFLQRLNQLIKLGIVKKKNEGKFKDICSELKRVVIGWLNYYAIADVKTWVKSTNKWLRRRLRMLFWKRWKLPKTRKRKLIHLGTPEKYAYQAAYSRRGYWFVVKTGAVTRALSNEKLVSWGYVDILKAYEFKHSKPVQLCFVF